MERRSACLFIAVSDHQSSGVWGPRISGTGCQAGLRPVEENVNDFCGLWAHQQHLCDGKSGLSIGVPGYMDEDDPCPGASVVAVAIARVVQV